MTHCCVFFYSDSSVVHVPKSKLTLRGNFDIGEEVEAKFKVAVADKENGKVSESWVNYLGKIVLLDANKEKMKAFENFYKNRSADDEEKGVKPVFEFARELAHNEENWFSQKSQDTKRKRKTTKKMAESLGQEYEDGAEKENLSAKSAKCKKTDENEEIINNGKSTKKSNTKKIKEDAQKGAVQTVLQSILPTLLGGFAAQWGSPSLSKSYSNQSISLTSVPVSQQNTSNQTTPTTQLQLHNSSFTQTATKDNQIQPPVSTSTAPIQLSVSTTTVLPASHPCLVPETVKTTKTPAPTLTPIPTEPQIPTQTQHSTSKPQETPVTNDIATNSVISQLSTKISTQEILTVSGTVMTPRQCTQQRPGPSPHARHQLHLTPNHNLTIQSDPSSSLPNTPPEEMNSGANWTNIIMSPYYPDPNEILDEIRLINKPTYQDLEKTIQELTDINKNLKDEIKSLQQQLRLKQTNNETSSGQIKVPEAVYTWMKNVIENCHVSQIDDNLTYSVRANLDPSETGSQMTLLLEENPESAVSRSELRKALSLAAKHGPVKLLHHVIRLMFPVEELASSCGKGLRKNKSGREAWMQRKSVFVKISFDHGAQRMTGTSPMTKRRMSVLQMKLLMQEKNLASLKRTSKHYVKQKDFMNCLSQLIFPEHNLSFNLGKPLLILSFLCMIICGRS